MDKFAERLLSKPNPAKPYVDDLLKGPNQGAAATKMISKDRYVGPYLSDLFGRRR